MTIPNFRRNLFAGLVAATSPRRQLSKLTSELATSASSQHPTPPVKSSAMIEAERPAADRARLAAAAEQQRKAEIAAAEENARRRAASDAVWAKAWAPRESHVGVAEQRREDERKAAKSKANGNTHEQCDLRSAKQKASDEVWERASAKLAARYAHLQKGVRR